jgi:glycine oxidase
MSSEILIAGGGVIGLAIARELHKRGVQKITIVERGHAGGEASWAAAGMLAPNIEAPKQNAFHRFCTEALEIYPEFAAELLDETGIDIELDQSGTLCIGFGEADDAEIGEHAARGFRKLSAADVREIEPSISNNVTSGILFPDDCQVENRKLLDALRASVENRGIRMHEDTEILRLLTDGSKVTGARTADGDLYADVTVLATGAWTSLIKIGDTEFPVTVSPIRGQMISFETSGRSIRRVVFSPRGYLVPRADGRVLVGATVEDVGFDKTTTEEALDTLKQAAVEIAPELARFEIAEHWAGLRPYAADGFPVLGELPGFDNVFVATAHYRNGILLAPMTAKTMADQILGNSRSGYIEQFSVRQFSSTANANARS